MWNSGTISIQDNLRRNIFINKIGTLLWMIGHCGRLSCIVQNSKQQKQSRCCEHWFLFVLNRVVSPGWRSRVTFLWYSFRLSLHVCFWVQYYPTKTCLSEMDEMSFQATFQEPWLLAKLQLLYLQCTTTWFEGREEGGGSQLLWLVHTFFFL